MYKATALQSIPPTFPRPQRTNVPIKAMFFLCEIPPLALEGGITSTILLAGSVSPVKLDSSIFKSTACKIKLHTYKKYPHLPLGR